MLLLPFAKEVVVAEPDRNTGMRGITNPETDSGYVGISLTGSTREKKIVLAALWQTIGLTTDSFSQRRLVLLKCPLKGKLDDK